MSDILSLFGPTVVPLVALTPAISVGGICHEPTTLFDEIGLI